MADFQLFEVKDDDTQISKLNIKYCKPTTQWCEPLSAFQGEVMAQRKHIYVNNTHCVIKSHAMIDVHINSL